VYKERLASALAERDAARSGLAAALNVVMASAALPPDPVPPVALREVKHVRVRLQLVLPPPMMEGAPPMMGGAEQLVAVQVQVVGGAGGDGSTQALPQGGHPSPRAQEACSVSSVGEATALPPTPPTPRSQPHHDQQQGQVHGPGSEVPDRGDVALAAALAEVAAAERVLEVQRAAATDAQALLADWRAAMAAIASGAIAAATAIASDTVPSLGGDTADLNDTPAAAALCDDVGVSLTGLPPDSSGGGSRRSDAGTQAGVSAWQATAVLASAGVQASPTMHEAGTVTHDADGGASSSDATQCSKGAAAPPNDMADCDAAAAADLQKELAALKKRLELALQEGGTAGGWMQGQLTGQQRAAEEAAGRGSAAPPPSSLRLVHEVVAHAATVLCELLAAGDASAGALRKLEAAMAAANGKVAAQAEADAALDAFLLALATSNQQLDDMAHKVG
jgi:hypothetical protein